MRICVISYHSSPLEPAGSGTSGGMNIFITNLYKKLARSCKIDIYVYGKKSCVLLGPNIEVIHLNHQSLDNFADAIINYHIDRQYNIIHTHYWLSGMVGLLMKKMVKIPWLHSFHTVEMFKGAATNRLRIEIEKEIIKSCDFIISPTYHEALVIKELFPKSQVITIPHGVDTRRFTPGSDGDKNLLYVGRIDPIKGLDILIDALRLLKCDVKLNIIGGPSKGRENYEKIKSYAKGLRVNFIGRVSHNQLSEHYQKSSMVIIPSYYESFGLVGLETMASAKPVIGFDDTGLSETVGKDAGILVKRNTRNLANAIVHLINNQVLRHNLGKVGRKKALYYDWHNIASSYLLTYEKIIKK